MDGAVVAADLALAGGNKGSGVKVEGEEGVVVSVGQTLGGYWVVLH